MRAARIVTLGFVLTCAGCASEIEGQDTYGEGGGSETIDLGPLEAPVLEAVIPMSKVLRVRWSLPSTCDSIDGERRTDAMTFIPVFSTIGTDTDYVDGDANENQSYTYRVRCVRGDKASDWSNLMSGNPYIE